ncbi:uncharacterized protein LOC129599810 [Paramacrobiotus metropolitanus]|uniref:uncharacterized protein LOC129599810 n=1 Tax=Paramacrobiotus metropolitanus TaxID=2943436 RepID=UPI0024463EE9|nr:uncharacterized protein LOC129599810 [Paramacrobiotus metropolitanus]
MIRRWILCVISVVVVMVRAQSSYNSSPGVCTSQKIDHSNLTGEALYQAILNDYIATNTQLNTIATANMNRTLNNQTDFFLNVIVTSGKTIQLIIDLGSGKLPINFNSCYAVISNSGTVLDATIQHANDVITGGTCDQLTGEAKYQYLLQQLGQFYTQDFAIADANAANPNPYPGTYLQTLLDAANNTRKMLDLWHSIQAGTAGAFNATVCELLTGVVALSNSPQVNISSSLGRQKSADHFDGKLIPFFMV